VGDREDSDVYIRMKMKTAEEIGIKASNIRLSSSTTEEIGIKASNIRLSSSTTEEIGIKASNIRLSSSTTEDEVIAHLLCLSLFMLVSYSWWSGVAVAHCS